MDNRVSLILLFLILNRRKDKDILDIPMTKQQSLLDENFWPLKNKTLSLNLPYTIEKIRIMKKIGPYFPEEFIPALNKALVITEKVIKLYETMEFMQITESKYIEDIVIVENNKERLSYIVNIIQKEFPKEEVKDIGRILEMILNIDKYKKMLTSLNFIMSNPDNLNDPTNMLTLIEPFMEDKNIKDKEKLKDMVKMVELMKTLDTKKKSVEKDAEVDNNA